MAFEAVEGGEKRGPRVTGPGGGGGKWTPPGGGGKPVKGGRGPRGGGVEGWKWEVGWPWGWQGVGGVVGGVQVVEEHP